MRLFGVSGFFRLWVDFALRRSDKKLGFSDVLAHLKPVHRFPSMKEKKKTNLSISPLKNQYELDILA